MPKSRLAPPMDQLESDILETLLAGHKEYRPDLAYPQSHSDMQGAVRALLRMYEIKRRPLAVALEFPCHHCEGLGHFRPDDSHQISCEKCKGHGRIKENTPSITGL